MLTLKQLHAGSTLLNLKEKYDTTHTYSLRKMASLIWPKCSCGWGGSAKPTEEECKTAFDRHVQEYSIEAGAINICLEALIEYVEDRGK